MYAFVGYAAIFVAVVVLSWVLYTTKRYCGKRDKSKRGWNSGKRYSHREMLENGPLGCLEGSNSLDDFDRLHVKVSGRERGPETFTP